MPSASVKVAIPPQVRAALNQVAERRATTTAQVIRDLIHAELHTADDLDADLPEWDGGPRLGHRSPRANQWVDRRQLPADVAQAVLAAVRETGMTWSRAARTAAMDTGHLWRICHGQRVPSPVVAEQIIITFGLDDETAAALRAEAWETAAGRRMAREQA